jgi:hypothetical protein
MVPSKVDPNRKQANSSIDQVEEDPFCIDRMAKNVSTLMSMILSMTVLKQLTQMLSRQNQLLILMLIIMMYHKKNYQFNLLMKVRKSIQLIRQLM